ncbi:MAG: hypothetical protein HY059_09975 [Proteobacteria bacterium]|nr:hypothetical protein [Pseudomonadota bacterium]
MSRLRGSSLAAAVLAAALQTPAASQMTQEIRSAVSAFDSRHTAERNARRLLQQMQEDGCGSFVVLRFHDITTVIDSATIARRKAAGDEPYDGVYHFNQAETPGLIDALEQTAKDTGQILGGDPNAAGNVPDSYWKAPLEEKRRLLGEKYRRLREAGEKATRRHGNGCLTS